MIATSSTVTSAVVPLRATSWPRRRVRSSATGATGPWRRCAASSFCSSSGGSVGPPGCSSSSRASADGSFSCQTLRPRSVRRRSVMPGAGERAVGNVVVDRREDARLERARRPAGGARSRPARRACARSRRSRPSVALDGSRARARRQRRPGIGMTGAAPDLGCCGGSCSSSLCRARSGMGERMVTVLRRFRVRRRGGPPLTATASIRVRNAGPRRAEVVDDGALVLRARAAASSSRTGAPAGGSRRSRRRAGRARRPSRRARSG